MLLRHAEVNLREMVNACLYLEKAGCPWRFLPKEFGPWQTGRTRRKPAVLPGTTAFGLTGLWSDIAALLTRAVRAKRGRDPEPTTALLDSQSVSSGPQTGPRGIDGNKKVRGIERHVPTCSLGFVLAIMVTAANVHDAQPVGALLDRAAGDGWAIERVKVDGIYVGPQVAQAAATIASCVLTIIPDTAQCNRIGSGTPRVRLPSSPGSSRTAPRRARARGGASARSPEPGRMRGHDRRGTSARQTSACRDRRCRGW